MKRLKFTSRGINLLEVLIVVVIIAILTALAIPTFTKTVETAKDKEAWTNLRLIRAGEKTYRLKNLYYYPSSGTESDIADINADLKLQLDPEVAWDYSVTQFETDDFEAEANRLNPPTGYAGSWKLHKDGVITKAGNRPSPNP